MAKSKPVKKVSPKREAKGGTKKDTVATPVIGRPRYEDGKIILRMAIKDSYDDFVLLDVADDDTDEDNAAELQVEAGAIDEELWCVDGTIVRANRETFRTGHGRSVGGRSCGQGNAAAHSTGRAGHTRRHLCSPAFSQLGTAAADVRSPPATVEERLCTTRHGRFLQEEKLRRKREPRGRLRSDWRRTSRPHVTFVVPVSPGLAW